jgi:hypothetical protein
MKNEHDNERMLSNLAVRTHFTWSALLLAAFYPVMLVWPFASSSLPGFSVLHVAASKTHSLLFVSHLLQIQSYYNTTHSIILDKSEPEQSIKEFAGHLSYTTPLGHMCRFHLQTFCMVMNTVSYFK